MRRWHSPREQNLVFRRWRQELAKHGDPHPHSKYRWFSPKNSLAPPGAACDVDCHCAAGPGTMRKATLSGHSHACGLCNYSKYLPKGRHNRRLAAVRFELDADNHSLI